MVVNPPSDKSVVNNKNFIAVLLFAVIAWFMNEMLYDLAIVRVTTDDFNSE
jgi:hypothetical protein